MISSTSAEFSPLVLPDGLDWTRVLASGETVGFRFRDVRRERTGVHSLVAITLNGAILSHDTFNISRSEDRRRLAKAAFDKLGEVHRVVWPRTSIEYDLDICSLRTPRLWEEERIEVVQYTHTGEPAPVRFALRPYVIQGGGTIFFAAPGSGKSYCLQAMAICLSRGHSKIWQVEQCPVLYINLERAAESMRRREYALLRALGLTGDSSSVSYIHARGLSIAVIQRRAQRWIQEHGGHAGVMLDSLSRGGVGDLNENQDANRFIDIMNGLGATWWAAIGHTPRQSSDHLYGSVHFDAGEDIGVKVTAQNQGTTVGMALQIVKANDIGRFTPQYLALEFEEQDKPIKRFRLAQDAEFPDLAVEDSQSDLDIVKAYVLKVGRATATLTSEQTGVERSKVSRLFQNLPFRYVGKQGRDVLYAVSTNTQGNGDDSWKTG